MPLNVFWFRHTYSIPCWATLCFNITLTSINMNSFWLSCCKPTTDKLRDLADILQIPHCNITGTKYIRHCWKCHISLIWKQYRTNCYSNGSIRLNHSSPKDRSNVNLSILLHVLHCCTGCCNKCEKMHLITSIKTNKSVQALINEPQCRIAATGATNNTRLTALCPGLPGWAGTRKVKSIWILLKRRDGEWQWHQLGHMEVCTSIQADNHASTPPLSFLQAGCPSCRPTNSVKALKALEQPVLALTYQPQHSCDGHTAQLAF